jgi:hypothetical protein
MGRSPLVSLRLSANRVPHRRVHRITTRVRLSPSKLLLRMRPTPAALSSVRAQ